MTLKKPRRWVQKRLGFSPAQQGQFRPLLAAAWQAECRLSGADPTDQMAGREWYENELEVATGNRSSKECDKERDFEAAMAHFEAIVGESIYWQMRYYSGDARRIVFSVQKDFADFSADDAYMLSIARQEIGASVNDWKSLTAEHLFTIRRALKNQARRQRDRGDKVDQPRREMESLEGDPF